MITTKLLDALTGQLADASNSNWVDVQRLSVQLVKQHLLYAGGSDERGCCLQSNQSLSKCEI